jgi:hypothetical protein
MMIKDFILNFFKVKPHFLLVIRVVFGSVKLTGSHQIDSHKVNSKLELGNELGGEN